MRKDRLAHYKKLEELRGSKLLVYVTSDRLNAGAKINSDALAYFSNHLDLIGDVEKISLFLYSNGGAGLAAWNIVNLIRSFCNDFEVIIPFRCQSAATLISLGSNRMVMTRQATLGPIDPSINSPINPLANVNGKEVKFPVNVEHVSGYLDMAKKDLGISNSADLKDIYLKLAGTIHPLILGTVYKSRSQIKMLAQKLMKYHIIEKEKIPKVINFLCSESGSHDYTINRREAKEELGLNVEKPDDELYAVIKAIYHDIETELQLRNPHNVNLLLAHQSPCQYIIYNEACVD